MFSRRWHVFCFYSKGRTCLRSHAKINARRAIAGMSISGVGRQNVSEIFSVHLGLSGGGEVECADSMRFGNNDGPIRGRIMQWTNRSGHYRPPVSMSKGAGLQESSFSWEEVFYNEW